MLWGLSVLPGFGEPISRAGVADDLDESIHVLVIAELYEKLGGCMADQARRR